MDIFILFTNCEKSLKEICIPESMEGINRLIINSNIGNFKTIYICLIMKNNLN